MVTSDTRSVAHQLIEMYRSIISLLETTLPEDIAGKLSIKQLLTLQIIREQPGITQKEVAQFLDVRASTTSVAIRQLETLGLIDRRADRHDRRIVRLYLSERALKAPEQPRTAHRHKQQA
jgi:DNA-binding MarR family transcriptional regulator